MKIYLNLALKLKVAIKLLIDGIINTQKFHINCHIILKPN